MSRSPLAWFVLSGYVLMTVILREVDGFYEYRSRGTIFATNMNTSSDVGEYDFAEAMFGPDLSTQHYQKGMLHKAFPVNGCGRIDWPPHGNEEWIALIERSSVEDTDTCNFIEKVLNAQRAGYTAAIIYDYDPDSDELIQMESDNATLKHMVIIPSVFVLESAGAQMCSFSYPDAKPAVMTSAEFRPIVDNSFTPYQILIPMAFSFVGVLLVAITVMIVRWCQAITRRRRSRISKSQLKKLPVVKYKSGDQYDCCAICLDDYEEGEKVRLLPCAHTYHQKCVDPWLLKNKRTCPVCKRRVIPKAPRRTRRASDSTESEDSEPGEGSTNERTPLLPSPAGRAEPSDRSAPAEERLGAVGGSAGYGSSGVAGRAPAARGRTGILRNESLPSDIRSRRYLDSQPSGPQHFPLCSSSDDDESFSDGDLRRRDLLIHVSMTPQCYVDSAHSLHSLTGRLGTDNSAFLVPPIGAEGSVQSEDECSGVTRGDTIIAIDQPGDTNATPVSSTNSDNTATPVSSMNNDQNVIV